MSGHMIIGFQTFSFWISLNVFTIIIILQLYNTVTMLSCGRAVKP